LLKIHELLKVMNSKLLVDSGRFLHSQRLPQTPGTSTNFHKLLELPGNSWNFYKLLELPGLDFM